MVVAPAQGEMRLGPDDLSAQLKPAGGQIGADDVAVQELSARRTGNTFVLGAVCT
jgi:hypothetical protein